MIRIAPLASDQAGPGRVRGAGLDSVEALVAEELVGVFPTQAALGAIRAGDLIFMRAGLDVVPKILVFQGLTGQLGLIAGAGQVVRQSIGIQKSRLR